jgi:prepilin-type N-terminal cleavage/methylation domain-containing protein
MRLPNAIARTRGAGFTLVEMLVALTIIVVLATLAVAILPRALETQKAGDAAGEIQSALQIVRNRAMRDRLPTGLRIEFDPNGLKARELRTIQQPPDWSPTSPFSASPRTITVTETWTLDATLNVYIHTQTLVGLSAGGGDDFTGGIPDYGRESWPVQPGDYLVGKFNPTTSQVIQGVGVPHQVVSIPISNVLFLAPSERKLPLSAGSGGPTITPAPSATSTDWRVIRGPRVLAGENPVQLRRDAVIQMYDPNRGNLALCQNVPFRSVAGQAYYEIVFSPEGTVIGKGTVNDLILLWVRDETLDDTFAGSPMLVSVNIRNGSVTVHPVNTTPGADPYSAVRDGRSSGL